jgi:L-threonylcarbamoyladenylate synthase
VGIESTVVSIVDGKITLLRPGHVALNSIAEITGRPVAEIALAAVPATDSAHAAPGMHERHYSPRTPLVLTREPDPRGAYLYHTDDRTHAVMAARAVQMPDDPEAYAAHLYGALHELDRAGLPVISVEPPPETPEWDAVWDRLRRAASK